MGLFDNLFGKTLYFPGCFPKYKAKDIQRRHEQLLTMFGIKYIKLAELEVCCGKPALDYGFLEEFQSLRSRNANAFKNQRIKKIIVSCPECYYTFKKNYEDIEVQHISQVILENISKIEKNLDGEDLTYYDCPNPLKLKELYDVPRKILEDIKANIVELHYNKEMTMDSGKLLEPVSPKIAEKMADAVLKEVKTKKLVVLSPEIYLHLKNHNKYEFKILELSEVLL